MIEHELLFLGLLKDGPKHGYEIKRLIDEDLFPFIGLKVKSVYYPLKKMEKLGLITKKMFRESNFPEKYVYSLTEKGIKIFDHLITDSFLSIERPYFNIDLSLYFLQYVDKKIVKRQLRGRIISLRKIKRDMEVMKKNIKQPQQYLKVILEHDIDLVEAEAKSIKRLMDKVL